MKEKEVQQSILQYLALKRSPSRIFWRNNTGAYKTEHGSYVSYGTPGSPDIFCIWDGIVYGIEVKAPKGRQSDTQKSFEYAFASAGGIYIIAHSIDDVIAAGL